MLHILPLQIAKSRVNISYFALFTSPNCKKHSKYKLFITFYVTKVSQLSLCLSLSIEFVLKEPKQKKNSLRLRLGGGVENCEPLEHP